MVYNKYSKYSIEKLSEKLIEHQEQFRQMLLNEDNDAAKRFYGMGFTLGSLEVTYDDGARVILAIAEFTCVCGRRERFQFSQCMDIDYPFLAYFPSFYEMLETNGSMSREHLLQDGYTAAQIDDMEARYERQQKGLSKKGGWNIGGGDDARRHRAPDLPPALGGDFHRRA